LVVKGKNYLFRGQDIVEIDAKGGEGNLQERDGEEKFSPAKKAEKRIKVNSRAKHQKRGQGINQIARAKKEKEKMRRKTGNILNSSK